MRVSIYPYSSLMSPACWGHIPVLYHLPTNRNIADSELYYLNHLIIIIIISILKPCFPLPRVGLDEKPNFSHKQNIITAQVEQGLCFSMPL